MHVCTWISIIVARSFLSFTYYLYLCIISTSTLFLYVELVYFKSFLTWLLCYISTIIGTNFINSADVLSSNKQFLTRAFYHNTALLSISLFLSLAFFDVTCSKTDQSSCFVFFKVWIGGISVWNGFTSVNRNQVVFTPTQIEAIRSGMQPGLTMVQ